MKRKIRLHKQIDATGGGGRDQVAVTELPHKD